MKVQFLEVDTDVLKIHCQPMMAKVPAKAPTAAAVYTFNGWTPEVSKVKDNVTYTATYLEEAVDYTVTWKK